MPRRLELLVLLEVDVAALDGGRKPLCGVVDREPKILLWGPPNVLRRGAGIGERARDVAVIGIWLARLLLEREERRLEEVAVGCCLRLDVELVDKVRCGVIKLKRLLDVEDGAGICDARLRPKREGVRSTMGGDCVLEIVERVGCEDNERRMLGVVDGFGLVEREAAEPILDVVDVLDGGTGRLLKVIVD